MVATKKLSTDSIRAIRWALCDKNGETHFVWDPNYERTVVDETEGLIEWTQDPECAFPQDPEDYFPSYTGRITEAGKEWAAKNTPHGISYFLSPREPSKKLNACEIGFVTLEDAQQIAKDIQELADKIEPGTKLRLSRERRPVPLFPKRGFRMDTVA